MSQTAYSSNQAIAREGQLADLTNKDALSKVGEVILPFGKLAVRGADVDNGAKQPILSTEITDAKKVLGIVIESQALESKVDSNPASYAALDMASVLKRGAAFVKVEQAVTPASDVYVRFEGKQQVQTIDWDINFVTGNTVAFTINGASYTQVFTTDQATTIAAVAAQIQSHPDVATASVTATKQITVTGEFDKSVAITGVVVTGGASQAVETITETVAKIDRIQRGSFRADTDGGTAALIAGLRYRGSGSASDLVIMDINLI